VEKLKPQFVGSPQLTDIGDNESTYRPSASHLPAGASADLELPKQTRAYRNDSAVLADIRSRADRALPAV